MAAHSGRGNVIIYIGSSLKIIGKQGLGGYFNTNASVFIDTSSPVLLLSIPTV